jgi:uncharacterized protein
LALVNEDWDEIERLQKKVSKLEYEADLIKHAVREQLPRRYFMPVDRLDLENLLACQDKVADRPRISR